MYQKALLNFDQNIITPTAYDQISIYTLLINTLGSCLLLIASTVGFFHFLNKLSFFYKTLISSSIFLAALLGIGIFLQQVALLPDRIYPFLQLFGLVFFASGGVVWILFRGTNPKKLKFTLILAATFIGCLSFFSCSSTIAGFETSPFVGGEMAYYKLYETPQEKFAENWLMNALDKKINVLYDLPFTEDNHLDTLNVSSNSVLYIDKFYIMTGFRKTIGLGHLGQYKFIRIKDQEFSKLTAYDKNYNNGMVELDYKYNK
jgi:hypothetical protein